MSVATARAALEAAIICGNRQVRDIARLVLAELEGVEDPPIIEARIRGERWAVMRATIIERDGLVCGICGGGVEPDDVHVDHIRAIARGGRAMDPRNLQVTHSACNLRKGARPS